MKQKTDLTLPEWAFLDADYQTGNALTGRDILLHVRTHTILEFISIDDNMIQLSGEVKRMHFTYTNKYGLGENYVVAIHYSLESDFTGLDYVIQKAIAFFKEWMTWMDKTIETEDNSKIN
jgi:hypothetical protein